MEILRLIEESLTIEDLDLLREEVVRYLKTPRAKEVLTAWQQKYWALKQCPTCGHVK